MNSSTLHLLHRVHQCASDLFQEHMAEMDVTSTQYTVLVVKTTARVSLLPAYL